jgi:hypothetical protein
MQHSGENASRECGIVSIVIARSETTKQSTPAQAETWIASLRSQ